MQAQIIVENDKPILVLQSESAAEDGILDAVDLLDKYTMRFQWHADDDQLEHKVEG